jgi:hypothetical protein
MAIAAADLDVLLYLRQQKWIPDHATIVDIGEQQISNNVLRNPHKIDEVAQSFGQDDIVSRLRLPSPALVSDKDLDSKAPLAKALWRELGLSYTAIDIAGGAETISLDLNYDETPQDMIGKFNLVTNFGTTEHVANQLNAFKIIHELTATGGIMWHNVPTQGMQNHGLVNYNPKFFWMLSRSNGYKWLYTNYSASAAGYPIPENIVGEVARFSSNAKERLQDVRVYDAGLVSIFKKEFDIPFVAPLDVNTGATTDSKILADRYWTIFTPDAFERFEK